MPCRDEQAEQEDRSELKAKVDYLTRMLCSICRNVESGKAVMPSYVKNWWGKHKIEDAARLEKEKKLAEEQKKREELLKSLTKEQKRLLGIK